MSKSLIKISDLGEIRLLDELMLGDVTGSMHERSDDCARIEASESGLLWSIDPCPTPVAHWFGLDTAEVWGTYTATINLSDIAASGGKPIGMLVSLEMPDDTPIDFVKGFQKGLKSTLFETDTKLMGGNLKSSDKFRATGSILGLRGTNNITRYIDHKVCSVYVIGRSGLFWSSVIGNRYGWGDTSIKTRNILMNSLCYPKAKTEEGKVLGALPYQVACMDCSDGIANALYQLAKISSLDITVFDYKNFGLTEDCLKLLHSNDISIENACFQFGDWQLLCIVPDVEASNFEGAMKDFHVLKIASAEAGKGELGCYDGRVINYKSLNQNFSGGYNSIKSLDDLISTFMKVPVFK